MEETKSENTTKLKEGQIYGWHPNRYGNVQIFRAVEVRKDGYILGSPTEILNNKLALHPIDEVIILEDIPGYGKEFPKYLKSPNGIASLRNSFIRYSAIRSYSYAGVYYYCNPKTSLFIKNRSIIVNADDPNLILWSIGVEEINKVPSNYDDIINDIEEFEAQIETIKENVRQLEEKLAVSYENCIHEFDEPILEATDYSEEESVKVYSTHKCTKCRKAITLNETISVWENE